MKKIQESKIKMSRAVTEILKSYDEIVQLTPGLSEAVGNLTGLIEETVIHTKGQLKKGNELTTGKNESRNLLTTAVIQVCAALAAYGTNAEEPAAKILKEKYQLHDSEIKRKRDMQLVTFANVVYEDAVPHGEKLMPFVTVEEVTQLRTLIDNFYNSLPRKRASQTMSKLSTQNLEEAVARIDKLLNDVMDVLVKPWEKKNADFFKAYQNARIIVDSASRKSNKGDDPEPPEE